MGSERSASRGDTEEAPESVLFKDYAVADGHARQKPIDRSQDQGEAHAERNWPEPIEQFIERKGIRGIARRIERPW